MWVPKTWEMLKSMWPAVVLVLAAIVAVVVAAVVVSRGCASTPRSDYLDDAVDAVLSRVRDTAQANEERLLQLEGELFDLRQQVEQLDAEIIRSAEEREALHAAIEGAGSIDDIDRLLRGDLGGGRRPAP